MKGTEGTEGTEEERERGQGMESHQLEITVSRTIGGRNQAKYREEPRPA